jgi:hypothetical protein
MMPSHLLLQAIEPVPGAPNWEIGILSSVVIVVLGYIGKYLMAEAQTARADGKQALDACNDACDDRVANAAKACDDRIAKLEAKLDQSADLLRRQMESQQRQIEAQQQLIDALHAIGRPAIGGQ